jgi:hypothetical protein
MSKRLVLAHAVLASAQVFMGTIATAGVFPPRLATLLAALIGAGQVGLALYTKGVQTLGPGQVDWLATLPEQLRRQVADHLGDAAADWTSGQPVKPVEDPR